MYSLKKYSAVKMVHRVFSICYRPFIKSRFVVLKSPFSVLALQYYKTLPNFLAELCFPNSMEHFDVSEKMDYKLFFSETKTN